MLIITQLAKYLFIILLLLFSLRDYTYFRYRSEEKKRKAEGRQLFDIYVFDILGFGIIFMNTWDMKVVLLLAGIFIYMAFTSVFYRVLYPQASILLVNNMLMLLSVGFVIIARINLSQAIKQFIIAAGGTVLSFLVPVIVRKMKALQRLTWLYAVLGLLALGAVLALAAISGGAKLSIEVGGVTIQFSEIVKITLVFFLASKLARDVSRKSVVVATLVAFLHIGILILSRDLGTAAVFYIAYLVVLLAATRKFHYTAIGLLGGGSAAVAAYYLFGHVQKRVAAWRDPFSMYDGAGYQIVHGLFAIGAGGWFGTGLCQGSPGKIPVATKDEIFAAISEEFGTVFGICLILVCMSMFILIVNMSMQIRRRFYKLIALGLGVEYAFQVFLTIGGVTKFIPLTGITLPLVSYGGSSVVSTIIMLGIIQGLYILREDEEDELVRAVAEQQIGASGKRGYAGSDTSEKRGYAGNGSSRGANAYNAGRNTSERDGSESAKRQKVRTDTAELERELGSDVRAVMHENASSGGRYAGYEGGGSGGRRGGNEGSSSGGRRGGYETDGAGNRNGEYGYTVEEDENAVRKRIKKQRRKSYVYYAVTYFFVLIFLSLIGYMIFFNVKLRDGVMRSPYNKRQDAQAKYTTRGDITGIDGTVLATTEQDDEGGDYRVYPEGRAFAHVVGYNSHGKSGIESIFNYELLTSNEPITSQVINDLAGRKNNGDTVVSAIDPALQRTAYEALGDYQGAVVVLDPTDGAIRAMVSKPDFNPNTISEEWNDIISEEGNSVLVNRATQGRYAPGSTFKIITALAYLRKFGGANSFSYTCTGEIQAGEHTIHCSNGAEHGEQTLEEAFTNSCNCAFAYMGTLVGAYDLRKTAESLLFNGKLPAADLQSNASSFSLDKNAEEFLLMQTSFGQGKTLTSPYHMALIAAAVAQNGMLMQPYLVDHVESVNGSIISRTSPKEYRRIMTEREAAAVSQLMRNVVTDGTAYALADRSYTAYGKTGSAEYGKSDGTLGTHSWFTGYAELDGRKLVVAVIAEGAGSGSGTAVPIAKAVFDRWAD